MKLKLIRTSAIALAAGLTWSIPALAAGPLAQFAWSPSPIAPAASLPASPAAGSTVNVTVTAEDSSGVAISGATVYLSLSNTVGGGTAAVGQALLGRSPRAFLTDTNGHVVVAYTTPSVLPTGGQDKIKAANAATGSTITSTSAYCFGQVVRYVLSRTPLAAPGSLGASQSASYTLVAVNKSGLAVPNTPVYLALSGTGGGSAAVGTAPITGAFSAFNTSASGQIVVTYTASSNVATNTGLDTISAEDATTNPCVRKSETYSYAGPASYTMQGTPIAATGSIPANSSLIVILTAKDANGAPVPGAQVFLSFNNQSGGFVSAGRQILSSSPKGFLTNKSGQIVMAYTSPQFLPIPGTLDTITAQNLLVSPTVTQQDTYTY